MRALFAFTIALLLTAGFALRVEAANQFPDRIELPAGFRPEGIEVGRGHTFYVGSIPSGAVLKGDLRTGETQPLVPAQTGRAAIGVEYDNHNRLFVAGGNTGDGYVYDADTGATIATYDFADTPPATFVNDVVVTRTDAWFTDSARPVLYRVPIAPDVTPGTQADIEIVPLSGDFPTTGSGANGIDATPNGDTLVVVLSNPGVLFTVDPDTGAASEIALADSEDVVNGDGILLHGNTLYVVQNRLNQLAEIRLDSDLSSGVVLSRTTSELFDVPSTVAAFGSSLYLVNARFGVASPDTAAFWVARIDKP